MDAESEAVYPARFGSRVQLYLANGECKEAFTLDPHGTAADPLSDDELTEKFYRLGKYAPSAVDLTAIAQQVERLQNLSSVRELTRYLRG